MMVVERDRRILRCNYEAVKEFVNTQGPLPLKFAKPLNISIYKENFKVMAKEYSN